MPKSNRAKRMRGQAIDKIIAYNQIRRVNADLERHRLYVERELDRMAAKVRTLRYDEQAKAHTAPSAAAVVVGSAITNEWTTVEERPETHLIPRKSLTERLMLRMFKPILRFRDVPFRVLTQESRDALADVAKQIRRAHPANREAFRDRLMATIQLTFVEGSTPAQLEWKSPETLLNPVKPDKLSTVKVTRQAAYTKERSIEQETDELPTWDAKTPRTIDDEHPEYLTTT